MKRLLRSIVVAILEFQVRRLQQKNDFTLVAVVGSIGKTSTKLAIGNALSTLGKTQYQRGNYNDRVTVPLVFFGHKNPPKLTSITQWLKILIGNERLLKKNYPYRYVVVELGIDGPEQMKEFSYLDVDLAVVTAITPEHMANFTSLDDVAKEELVVASFSKYLLVNNDLVTSEHKQMLKGNDVKTYGTEQGSTVVIDRNDTLKLRVGGDVVISAGKSHILPKCYAAAAVLSVLLFVGETEQKVVQPIIERTLEVENPGRMQLLNGIHNAQIIDDTYNASPEAVKLALDVLRARTAPQKIAILGSMNELGKVSALEHKTIGKLCSPKDIDLLVTIGAEANMFLAPEAKKQGCEVKTFTNPFEAGLYVKEQLNEKAVILAKGSQNGVFAEEALKPLLKNRHDEKKLVRQSVKWLATKRQQFGLLT